jgi:phosphohistidine phosphatase
MRLILIRHAKSSWDDPLQADRARPLNARGRAAADALGHWLGSRGYLPDEVLCSPAERTRETWARIAPALDAAPALRIEDRLYQAGPEEMLAVLASARGQTVLMLGHNPGIAAFAERLLARRPVLPDFARYPTGATAIIDFPAAGWAEVTPGSGDLRDFTTPRALPGPG